MTASASKTASWTRARIPDQTGRRALITGGNSGIGFYTALELARSGAAVVLACRDAAKAETAAQKIRAQVPAAHVEVLVLDLASLASVHAGAAAELARDLPLDLLINNAGVMAPNTRQTTRDGFELQFGTNVLGHFALTGLLLPALARAASDAAGPTPRVVTIASIAHKRGRLNFNDLQSERSYNPMGAYQQTKLADLMFAFELQRRLERAAEPLPRIASLAAHPGVAKTNLFQMENSTVPRPVRGLVGWIIGSFLNTDVHGAIPTLYAATSPAALPGGYYGPQGFQELRGADPGPALIAPHAKDTAAAERLWLACEDLTGVRFL